MRRRYRFIDGQCVEVSDEGIDARMQILNDEMPATQHPLTGEVFTSKTKFRAVTKAHGYEEVGTAYENGWRPRDQYSEDLKRLKTKRIEMLRGLLG